MFLEDTPRHLALLRQAAARQDAGTLLEIGHALRGAAAHFGISELVELCERLEQLAQAGAIGGASDIVAELDKAYARARKTLGAVRARPGWSGQDSDEVLAGVDAVDSRAR